MVRIICLGMAGSGKTTFVQRLCAHIRQKAKEQEKDMKKELYVVNLDPAVSSIPYGAHIDIRDTVKYKEVCEKYELGPNGGIVTCLNLFTTKFDQVLDLMDKRDAQYTLLDTPGQIEIFTWSASGQIMTDALASSGPTVVAYVIDTQRTLAPATFMSNMLYACSILFKTRLPFILVFNKTDVQDAKFAHDWMTDDDCFQEALRKGGATDLMDQSETEPTYMNSLMSSMGLVLDEFYKNLSSVDVSALTGQGMDEFLQKVELAKQEYVRDYLPELEKMREKRRNANATQDGNGRGEESQSTSVKSDPEGQAKSNNEGADQNGSKQSSQAVPAQDGRVKPPQTQSHRVESTSQALPASNTTQTTQATTPSDLDMASLTLSDTTDPPTYVKTQFGKMGRSEDADGSLWPA